MKILIDHQLPFLLAHGGLQTQIERTKEALEVAGLEVEYLRWWEGGQSADIIHFFGRPHPLHIALAKQKGMKYVMSDLLSGQGSRPRSGLMLQGFLHRILRHTVPKVFLANLRWDSYALADAVIVLTEWERDVVRMLFGAPEARLHVVPNGVETDFFHQAGESVDRGDNLICTATITERKRVLELAEAAVLARTPLHVLGAPYGKDDSYHLRFLQLVDKHPDLLRYNGPIKDRAQLAGIYRSARGFVLLSTMESLSLSALEAAAAGCPLLLSDLPWARCTFGDRATYCPITTPTQTARVLREFHAQAPGLPVPPPPLTWDSVAEKLAAIYRAL